MRTAARSGEVRKATGDEVDLDGATWTVPDGRMKANREHRVPLSKPSRNSPPPALRTGPRYLSIFPPDPGRRQGRRAKESVRWRQAPLQLLASGSERVTMRCNRLAREPDPGRWR